MATYRLKDGTTLVLDYASVEKYLGIVMALRDISQFPQRSVIEFMAAFAQSYRQISDFPIRCDTAEHFALDLFLDGYLMVPDGSRG
ncbi:MAG: hypothetical protein H7Z75_17825 [Ferruginibacter sp.]|nr:hypothetical protein [Cytophagales bacterium]